MKVRFEGSFFGPDLAMYQPGVREVPDDWKDHLPSSAEAVGDDVPLTGDGDEEPEEPIALSELQRMTAAEGKKLREQQAKDRARIAELERQLSGG